MLPSASQVAQAGVLDSTVGFSSCAAAGFISNKVREGLDDLQRWVTNKLGGFLGVPVPGFGSRVPVVDESVKKEVENFKKIYSGKEGAQDIVARCTAREILTAMGRNIVNTARTGGRDGGPAWVRNWRNFRLNAQYRGEDIFRVMLASTNTCEYFANDLKGVFGANKKTDLAKIKTRANNNDSYQVRAGCTLPGNFEFAKYKKDFSGNGGWGTWSRLLEPQNNRYGSLFMALDEINSQRNIEEQVDVDEAGQTGFTAIRGRNAADNCAVRSPYGGSTRCLVYKDILTPGGIISGAVVAGVEAELQWVASTDELNELIATGIEVLINRLWDLSKYSEGNYIVPGSVDTNIPQFPPPGEEPQPQPDGGPIPPPEEPPPPGGGPTSLLSDLQAERTKYGTPMTPTELGQLLNAVAWKNRSAGWVLLGKATGNNCPAPSGALISCDFLVHQPTLLGYDVLIASDDQATPAWLGPHNMSGSIANGSRTLVAPTQP